MRRVIAATLALIFSCMLMMPAFAASTSANLPACCRKCGKHECAMSSTGAYESANSVMAVKAKCASFPRATAAMETVVFGPSTHNAVFAGVISHPSVSPQTEAGYRISFDRSRQKRGPPSFLLS